jgi:uncharacterized protein (TIGR00730 family)
VFCGSSTGADPAFAAAAEALGRALATTGRRLVYGGASVGLMRVVADAALGAGGEVIGVMPRSLVDREIAHAGLTELRIVTSMHERKAVMGELSNAFVALPGGLGTLDELFEIWTWGQLGIHDKPYGVLNISGYFDPLLQFLDRAVDAGFVRQKQRDGLIVAADVNELLSALARSTGA